MAANNSREATHCVRDHEFTEENIKWIRRTDGTDGWIRRCRQCQRERDREYQKRKRDVARIERLWKEIQQ